MWCSCLADRTDWPIRGNPFSRSMCQNCAESHDADTLVYRGGLHGRDLMLAQRLAHNIEPARERCIAEGSFCRTCLIGSDCSNQGLLGIDELGLSFAQGRSDRADGFTGAPHGWPPFREGRSSLPLILIAWHGARGRSPLWHPLASVPSALSLSAHGRERLVACYGIGRQIRP